MILFLTFNPYVIRNEGGGGNGGGTAVGSGLKGLEDRAAGGEAVGLIPEKLRTGRPSGGSDPSHKQSSGFQRTPTHMLGESATVGQTHRWCLISMTTRPGAGGSYEGIDEGKIAENRKGAPATEYREQNNLSVILSKQEGREYFFGKKTIKRNLVYAAKYHYPVHHLAQARPFLHVTALKKNFGACATWKNGSEMSKL